MWDDRPNRFERREDSPDQDESRPAYRERSTRAGDVLPREPSGAADAQRRGHDLPRGPLLPRRGRAPASADSPDTWRAAASAGMLIGILLIALSVVIAAFAVWQLRGTDGGARIVWLAVLIGAVGTGALVGYLLHGLTTIRYVLGQDRLIVRWMRDEQVVHYAEIVDTTYDPRVPVRLPAWEPFWPGYHVSTKRTPSGVWRSVATEEPRRRVRIATTRGIIAISPTRPVRFIVELDRRRAAATLGASRSIEGEAAAPSRDPVLPVQQPERRMEPPEPYPSQPDIDRVPVRREPFFDPRAVDDGGVPREIPAEQRQHAEHASSPAPFEERREIVRPDRSNPGTARYVYEQLFRDELLGDRVSSNLIAIGVAIPLLMAAFLFSQFEGVPNPAPLHWDALGEVDRVGQPSELWLLPIMAAIVLVVNTFAATLLMAVDRFLARLILLAIPIVQIVAFIALVRLVVS